MSIFFAVIGTTYGGDGVSTYKVLDPNTILSVYYTADYDGNETPAWVIVGNPLVLSSSTYSIYANGLKVEPPIDSVTNGNLRAVTSNAVFGEIKKWNTLGPVETIPVYYNTIQYGYTAPYDGILYLSLVTGINDIIYINDIKITAGITKDILQLYTINVNKGDVVRTGQAVSSFLFYACARFYRQRDY